MIYAHAQVVALGEIYLTDFGVESVVAGDSPEVVGREREGKIRDVPLADELLGQVVCETKLLETHI